LQRLLYGAPWQGVVPEMPFLTKTQEKTRLFNPKFAKFRRAKCLRIMLQCFTGCAILAQELNKCILNGVITTLNVIALINGNAKLRIDKLNV
jgi:hypothetical protein